MQPLLSVILPAYNAESTIHQAVDSILNQTWKEFELIIVNDGSTDKTARILGEIGDSRITLLHNASNMGIAKTMNRAFDAASGRFIAIMNADDLSVPERFEKQLRAMRDNEPHICSGWFHVMKEGTASLSHRVESDEEIKAAMLFVNQIGNPFVMLDGNFFRQHGLRYDETVTSAEDYMLWLTIIQHYKSARFYNIQEPLGTYTVHEHNNSTTCRSEQIRNAMTAQYALVKSFYPDVKRSDMLTHLNFFLSRFRVHSPEKFIRMRQWLADLDEANRKAEFFHGPYFHAWCKHSMITLCRANPQFPSLVKATTEKYTR